MKYQLKPIAVDAMRYDGANGVREILAFTGSSAPNAMAIFADHDEIIIRTHGGDLALLHGDWAIRADNGDVFPVKDSLFRKIYEREDAHIHEEAPLMADWLGP